MMKFCGMPFEEKIINLYTDTSRQEVRAWGGETGLVPVLIDGDTKIWDTLAIAEYLYEQFPVIWPGNKVLRAKARSICGEIHSGLNALRNAMPVNTRARNRPAVITLDVAEDIRRVQQIWESCLAQNSGEWLFGEFSAVDIFFAPVATRFQTYGVNIEGPESGYQKKILAHPLAQEWLEEGKKDPAFIRKFEGQQ